MNKMIRTIPLPSDVFRPEEKPMVARPMEMQVHPPPPELFRPSEEPQMLDVFHKQSLSTMRYPRKVDHASTQGESSNSLVQTGSSMFTIPRNIHGQRIDPPTLATQELVSRVKAINPCKDVHLRERCWRKRCEFSHGDLEGQELDALRHYSRQRPCRDENGCLNATCYWGHMCPWGPDCNRSRCQFRTHVVDFQVHHYVHQQNPLK